jgi:O-antigen ligase
MDLFILYIFALFRPFLSTAPNINILGFGIFDLLSIFFIGALLFAVLFQMATRKSLYLGPIDILIILFLIWCYSIALIYPEYTDIKDLVKFTFPFLTYTLAKNIIKEERNYSKLLFLLLLGFAIPTISSAMLILLGRGIEGEMYWTKLIRYQGVFDGAHDLGHHMGFFVMLMPIYFILGKQEIKHLRDSNHKMYYFIIAILVVSFVSALYCVIMSQVRTVYIGLIIFFSIFLLSQSKKIFILLVIGLIVSVILAAPVLKLVFLDVVQVQEGERPLAKIGSGRPTYWLHNLREFGNLSFERKIAGAGIGNKYPIYHINPNGESFWNSHNDILEVFIHTGIIGFSLYILMMTLLLKKILMLEPPQKSVYLALFLAVMFMNFASNSYVGRFGIGQMFFLVMIYVDINRKPPRTR